MIVGEHFTVVCHKY